MYSQNLYLDRLQLALLDWTVVFASGLVATWMRHDLPWFGGHGREGSVPWSAYHLPAALVALACVLVLYYDGLYVGQRSRLQDALGVIRAVTLGCTFVLAGSFFFRGYSYSRGTVLLFYPLCIVALINSRMLSRLLRRWIRTSCAAARRVLIVGCGESGRHIASVLLHDPAYYNLVGFVDDDTSKHTAAMPGVPVLGSTAELEDVVRCHAIDEIIIAIPSATPERIMDLIGQCLRLKVKWKAVPNLCSIILDRMHIDHIGELPLISLRGSKIVGINWALKRSFDVAFASLVLIAAVPLNLLVALLVKLSSSGPVLFKQTRVGLNGQSFTFLKFRSMRVTSNADVHKSFTADWIYGRTGETESPAAVSHGSASQSNVSTTTTHKLKNDCRITPLGRLLRASSLDELPQFWNVIRGEMSVVGPRPAIPYEVERYSEWHKRRLDVLPGITGLWQVNGRNSLSFDEMVRLDICYIESWTITQDIRIILKTIPSILFNRGH